MQRLQVEADVQVVASVGVGGEVLALLEKHRPAVVTIAAELSDETGAELTARIMANFPTPVVIVTAGGGRADSVAQAALASGAIATVHKPANETTGADLVNAVRQAAKVRVIRNLASQRPHAPPVVPVPPALPIAAPLGVVVIGASTGGPPALAELLGQLPDDFPAAVFVVQHLPAQMSAALAEHLQRVTPLRVSVARAHDAVEAGVVLVAPGGMHLEITPSAQIKLVPNWEPAGHCPSVDRAMQTTAQVFGARTVGVVLTGIGADGTAGLAAVRAVGGLTLAQEAASCVVNGMPQHAVDQGVVQRVADPAGLGRLLAAPWARLRGVNR
jgi:two-component system chemotaxis response regulator CheB